MSRARPIPSARELSDLQQQDGGKSITQLVQGFAYLVLTLWAVVSLLPMY